MLHYFHNTESKLTGSWEIACNLLLAKISIIVTQAEYTSDLWLPKRSPWLVLKNNYACIM